MKPAPFDYLRPASLAEAAAILKSEPEAAILAGGQSLTPMLNLRVASAEQLVDITRLTELREIAETADYVAFGALTTHAAIEDRLTPDPSNGLMPRVAAKIAYRAVRNLGTLGGSLSLADPSADWPACLLALDAAAIVVSTARERRIALDDFLVDAYETALQPGEILARVEVPKIGAARWGVDKVARKSGAFADSLAIAVLRDGAPARIALTGLGSRARLLSRTAAGLDAAPQAPIEDLRAVIAEEVADLHEDATPYQLRCHVSTVMSAVSEARR